VTIVFGHKKFDCSQCYTNRGATWGKTDRTFGAGSPPKWRIENTPASWGGENPRVVVLGFSRGQNQSHDRQPFDQVAFHGMRPALGAILRRLELLGPGEGVDARMRSGERDFAFSSLIRCSIAQWDKSKVRYAKSGNAILKTCLKDPDSRPLATACTEHFLAVLPERLRVVILLGNEDGYIEGCRELVSRLHAHVRPINAVAYGDDRVTWIHTVHAKAQGSHLRDWLDRPASEGGQGRKRELALQAIQSASN
jgi:hypothetical protein